MRLLTAALPEALRLLPTGHGLMTVAFVAVLAALEMVGRWAANDVHDALAGLVLLSAIALLVSRHRRDPIPWVGWVAGRAGRAGRRLERLRYDHGIDLRGSPAFPRRLPPAVWVAVAVIVVWGAAAASTWQVIPGGWRYLGVHSSYVVYLAVLFTVWSGLMACTFVGLYVPVGLLDRALRGRMREADRRGLELLLIAMYVLTMTAVAWVVPTAVALGLCLAAAAIAAVGVVRGGDVDEPSILWRSKAGSPIYAIPLRRVVAGVLGLAALLVFDLLLTACGGRLLTPTEVNDPMPITTTLGTMAAWMVPGIVAAAWLRLGSGQRSDPARRTAPEVFLQSDQPADAGKRAALAVKGWGWTVRVGTKDAKSRAGEVSIELVACDKSEATEFDPSWPLKVGRDDLSTGLVRDRLVRRDEVQLRRHLFRGLAVLLKRAAAERQEKGGGYWFAPHWWFLGGLDREEPGRGDRGSPPRQVGPPFHRVFGHRVRQHFHQVFRAVQIDMIFIEDGVSHRSFAKVLRSVFELYDVHGGKRRAEDVTFVGIPKVRVMVHEYAPEKPARPPAGYRESHFDELSRARVLHVYRDTGGHEAEADTPFDTSWEPSPALGIG